MTTREVLDWCWQHPVIPVIGLVMLGLYVSSALGYWPAKAGLTKRGRARDRRRWDDGTWTDDQYDEDDGQGGGPGIDGRH